MMRRTGQQDSGSAVIEFIVVVVLVMVPVVYGIIVVLRLHAASSAVIVAARESGRAYVTADSPSQGGVRARTAAAIALADQGFSEHEVRVRCFEGPCLSPGSRVHVEVETSVPIPFLPFSDGHGTIPVSSSHDAVVDTYRESP